MLFTRSSARKDSRRCIEVSRLLPCAKLRTRVRFIQRVQWLSRDVTGLSGANFTAYQELKKVAHRYQPDLVELPSYQHMIIGLISGAMGPFSNAPIDTIKTREWCRDDTVI